MLFKISNTLTYLGFKITLLKNTRNLQKDQYNYLNVQSHKL